MKSWQAQGLKEDILLKVKDIIIAHFEPPLPKITEFAETNPTHKIRKEGRGEPIKPKQTT